MCSTPGLSWADRAARSADLPPRPFPDRTELPAQGNGNRHFSMPMALVLVGTTPTQKTAPFVYRNTLPAWNDINLPHLCRYARIGGGAGLCS